MYECVCACVGVGIYVCMHVFMCVCMYGYMYVCMYVSMNVCIYERMYVCMYVCIFYPRRPPLILLQLELTSSLHVILLSSDYWPN